MDTDNLEQKSNSSKSDCEARMIVVFFACSGSANCGQIANQSAIKLTEQGVGHMYCLSGIGSHHEGMIEGAKSADRVVVLDGCPTACAKKTSEHAGIRVTDWVCVTQNGIKKVHNFDIKPEEVERIVNKVKVILIKN